jgi:NADH-quinone oxidoreductase subunit N
LIGRGYIFLAVVAILASVVALFLYARVLKPMYFGKPAGEDLRRFSPAAAAALVVCFLFTFLLGVWPQLLVAWAKAAVVPLLPRI